MNVTKELVLCVGTIVFALSNSQYVLLVLEKRKLLVKTIVAKIMDQVAGVKIEKYSKFFSKKNLCLKYSS